MHDHQHQISRCCAFFHFTGELKADNFRNQHGDRLAEHGGLGFNATDTPAEHGQTVDHRRVTIGANQRIWIGYCFVINLIGPNCLRQELEIYLVANAGAGRHNTEIIKGFRTPTQKLIAFLVALKFFINISVESFITAVIVNHH